ADVKNLETTRAGARSLTHGVAHTKTHRSTATSDSAHPMQSATRQIAAKENIVERTSGQISPERRDSGRTARATLAVEVQTARRMLEAAEIKMVDDLSLGAEPFARRDS